MGHPLSDISSQGVCGGTVNVNKCVKVWESSQLPISRARKLQMIKDKDNKIDTLEELCIE